MTSNRACRQMIFQNENLDFHHKAVGSVADGRTVSVKKASKRVALNDISNSSLHHGATSRKKTHQKEELNICEEGFLHDHKKCIDARRKELEYNCLELVLLGHDSVTSMLSTKSEQEKVGLDCPPRGLEPIKEVPMSDFSSCLDSPTLWDSPGFPTLWYLPRSPTLWYSPCSPTLWDSPRSPTLWETLWDSPCPLTLLDSPRSPTLLDSPPFPRKFESVEFVLKPGIDD